MLLPFPPPYTSENFACFRDSLPKLTRQLLSGIWEYRIANNNFIFVRNLHRAFPDSRAEEELEKLGPAVVSKDSESGTYSFTILAALLAESGEEDELRLVRYLEYLRERENKEGGEFRVVLESELREAWPATHREAFRVCCMAGLIRFCHRTASEVTFNNWHLAPPRFLHQIRNEPDLLELVRLSAMHAGLFDSGVLTEVLVDDTRAMKRALGEAAKQVMALDHSKSKEKESKNAESNNSSASKNLFIQKSKRFVIRFKEEEKDFRVTNGLLIIAHLLRNPDQNLACKDLKPPFAAKPKTKPPSMDDSKGISPERKRVWMALDRAFKILRKKKFSELEMYLRNSITRESTCRYTPQDGVTWSFE